MANTNTAAANLTERTVITPCPQHPEAGGIWKINNAGVQPRCARCGQDLVIAPAAYTTWKGDAAVYTGKTEVLHGGLFYELLMLEGHLTGQMKLTLQAPKGGR